MASKPELHVTTTMPAASPDTDAKRPRSALRSPRFREDFDAPFSEALLNASTMTLATESQHPSDMSMTKPAYSPRPTQSREDSWSSTNSNRSASSSSAGVNDRIKEWARKSLRRRSDDRESQQPS